MGTSDAARGRRTAFGGTAVGLAAIASVVVWRSALVHALAGVAVGMTLSIAAARVAAARERALGPRVAIAVASFAGLTLVVLDLGRPEPFFFGIVGALLGARVARDHERRIPGSSEGALLRRALRGILLALPFAIAAIVAATRDTIGESSEGQFYRVLGVILPSSLIAGWFASGSIAPAYALFRSRIRTDP